MWRFALAPLLLGVLAGWADAHSGRRLLIEVVDGKLRAQGVNTGPDDGAPFLRPYPNAIHDHWGNVQQLGIATASLPGFDVLPSAANVLQGHRLGLRLDAVFRWSSPPMMPPPDHQPRFEGLGPGRQLTIVGPSETIDSGVLGELMLLEDVPPSGVADLDLVYGANWMPADEIHVLRFELFAESAMGGDSPASPSDPVYVLLSPDGANPMERLHHASLFLEGYLASIPEPSAAVLAWAGLALLNRRRRG